MTIQQTIYLLRHGAIVGAGERRLVGQMDLPLSEQGVRQAQWWRDQWATTRFARIWCSDLQRSKQTAEIIAEKADCQVEMTRELRELNLGEWEGLSPGEIAIRFPGDWEQRGKDFAHFRPAGGESFADLSARVLPVFESVHSGSGGTTLIVGHSGVNRVILCHLLGMPLHNLFRLGQDFGALNVIEAGRDMVVVKLLNRRPDLS